MRPFNNALMADKAIVESKFKRLCIFLLIALAVGISAAFMQHRDTRRLSTAKSGDNTADATECQNWHLMEDAYSLCICRVILDTAQSSDDCSTVLTACRLLYALLLVVINVALQVFLIEHIVSLVVPFRIDPIRNSYEAFERHMYAGHTTLSANGEERGVHGYFDPARFDTLDEDVKGMVCSIPFSQPRFFIGIVFIWTLTCVGEMKQCVDHFYSLIVMMPTVLSMGDGLQAKPGSQSRAHVVDGLPRGIKALILVFIIVPRVLLTCLLCWLGCRWLAATADFGDLVLNAIAAEFILQFKGLFYLTLVPVQFKEDLRTTEFLPPARRHRTSVWALMNMLLWGVLAFGWACFYMFFFQMVLISYQWDVHGVCDRWITATFSAALV